MISTRNRFRNFLLLTLLPFFTSVLLGQNMVHAGQLQLSWGDTANDETGFGIERKAGTTGTYNQIATVAANVLTYTDPSLTNGTTYCYRVYAFNTVGNSPYSPEACGTPTTTTVQTFGLTVAKTGTGGGTVTSSPAGINCGTTCSATYNSGTALTLTATAATGSIFAGWSGTGCTTGSVTMNATTSCTATFNLQTFGLSVAKAGTGSGTVTSSPAGINCGTTCSATYNSGTPVTLSATAATGSTFAGWSGTGCTTGTVTMNAAMSCTATFNLQPPQTFGLSVAKAGTGNGTVTSSPGNINCGSTCSANYSSGTAVTLSASAATGSTFAGWSGTGCASGSVTMNAATSCTATFNLQTFGLSVALAGTGSGTVTSSPSGINCGSNCTVTYNSGTAVTLSAAAATGSTFTGWSGTGCASGSVTMNTATSCTATFNLQTFALSASLATRIGVFRPDTGEWFLDHSGNGQWDGGGVDIYIRSSGGASGELPVIGSWSGSGVSNIGTFSPSTGTWQLDTNGDGVLDVTVSYGNPGDLPVTRELSGVNGSIIGTFTPKSVTIVKGRKVVKRGLWNFDLNDNSTFDGCSVDECDTFGDVSELPVVGDWNGTGTEEIGLFLPSKGQWFLDLNGNGKWDGCRRDKCLGRFGSRGDLPVVGDWDGTGKVRIGVFRPSTGMWYLDMNGNGKLDKCGVDACLGPFGLPGDLPVVGKW
jgi:hypothetical protein